MSFMTIPHFRKLKEGDIISAREWNALVDLVKAFAGSTMQNGFCDSTGMHPRATLKPSVATRTAYTLTTSFSLDGNVISCSLDEPGGSNEIEVECQVYGGVHYNNLQYAIPRLPANYPLRVIKSKDDSGVEKWVCLSPTFFEAIRF